jgi:hypothetical protein
LAAEFLHFAAEFVQLLLDRRIGLGTLVAAAFVLLGPVFSLDPRDFGTGLGGLLLKPGGFQVFGGFTQVPDSILSRRPRFWWCRHFPLVRLGLRFPLDRRSFRPTFNAWISICCGTTDPFLELAGFVVFACAVQFRNFLHQSLRLRPPGFGGVSGGSVSMRRSGLRFPVPWLLRGQLGWIHQKSADCESPQDFSDTMV